MSGYLATNAELAQPINIEIPGTIISQTNGEVLKFDISGIDLKTAQSIAFQMPLDASGNTVDSYLSTETKPNEKYMYTLNKGENDIWAMQTKDIGIVKDQIGS